MTRHADGKRPAILWANLRGRIAHLEHELEEAKKIRAETERDAERYRALRESGAGYWVGCELLFGERIDAAVDAMREGKSNG